MIYAVCYQSSNHGSSQKFPLSSMHFQILLSSTSRSISSQVMSTLLGWSLFNCIFNASSLWCRIHTTPLPRSLHQSEISTRAGDPVSIPHSSAITPPWPINCPSSINTTPHGQLHQVVDRFIHQNRRGNHRPVKYRVRISTPYPASEPTYCSRMGHDRLTTCLLLPCSAHTFTNASDVPPWGNTFKIPLQSDLLLLLWALCEIKHKMCFWALCRSLCSVQANWQQGSRRWSTFT